MSTPSWSVERARQLNAKLSFAAVSVDALEAKHIDAPVQAPTWTFSMTLQAVQWGRVDQSVLALYPLIVTVQHVEGESRVDLGDLRVALRLEYRTSPDFSAADEEFVCDYLGTAGWLHAWPYLRAEIRDLSSRLGVPALVLPVLLAGQTSNIPCARIEETPVVPELHESAESDAGAPATKSKSKRKKRQS